jgi:hypothetical protein
LSSKNDKDIDQADEDLYNISHFLGMPNSETRLNQLKKIKDSYLRSKEIGHLLFITTPMPVCCNGGVNHDLYIQWFLNAKEEGIDIKQSARAWKFDKTSAMSYEEKRNYLIKRKFSLKNDDASVKSWKNTKKQKSLFCCLEMQRFGKVKILLADYIQKM